MKTLTVILLALGLSSCVSMQKFKDLEAKYNECSRTAAKAEKDNHDQTVQINELNAKLDQSQAQLDKNKKAYDDMEADYKLALAELEKSRGEYDELNAKYMTRLAGNRQENQKLLQELQEARENLNKREAEVEEKQKNLDRLMVDFQEKERKVKELQAILDRKDYELNALRDKVMAALTGFEGKGLTVHTKNGKVYVSMDEKLLFASGSWQVAEEGKKAIRELGAVLAKNPDISVMIEGHTDNVRLNGRGDVKDNWDLSVMRATSITKALLENKGIDPTRVIAAGRSEYVPLVENNTADNKAKNRRSEIILTPQLNELLNILEAN